MRLGEITTPSKKGQIVIPKKFRDALKISSDRPVNVVLRGNGIYIYPIKEVLTDAKEVNTYTHLLQKTQGAWENDTWEETRRSRRSIELEATLEKKRQW